MFRQLLLTYFIIHCLSTQFLNHPVLFFIQYSQLGYLWLPTSHCEVPNGTPCHVIGHQLLPTQPCYHEWYGFERAFSTLRRFYLAVLPAVFKASLGAGSLPQSQHSFMLIFETQPRPNCLLESQQSTKDLYGQTLFKGQGWAVTEH